MLETLADFGRLLRQRRQHLHLSLEQLSAKTGISKPYLANIETARLTGPASPDKLRALELALNFAPNELLQLADYLRTPPSIRALLTALPRRPDGAINLDLLLSSSSTKTPQSQPISTSADSLIPIPLINRVAAGHAAEFTDLDLPAGIADRYLHIPPASLQDPDQPPDHTAIKGAFALTVTGDSMLPDYHPGDILIVGPVQPHNGDDCLVRLGPADNFATTFKRVFFSTPQDETSSKTPKNQKKSKPVKKKALKKTAKAVETEGGGVTLVPLNPRYPQRHVPWDNITGVFPVLWKMTRIRHKH